MSTLRITKQLWLALLLAAPCLAHADSRFVGTWTSVTVEGLAVHGRLVFKADSAASIQAAGQPELNGTWAAADGQLSFTMPPYGTARMQYEFHGQGFTLTYENGDKQRFAKIKP